ncbi:MAG: hypothetical protein CFE44_17590, partial [Burkholderiales bacterium PBB4]
GGVGGHCYLRDCRNGALALGQPLISCSPTVQAPTTLKGGFCESAMRRNRVFANGSFLVVQPNARQQSFVYFAKSASAVLRL